MRQATINLHDLFLTTFARSMTKATVTSCSKWAEQYRIMTKPTHGPWRFTYHPWLREMHDAQSVEVVGQKAAQMGYSETLLNRVFYEMDVHQNSCLYVLPSKTPDATDFSVSRFDPAIEESPHLARLFNDVQNVGLKRAGAALLYVRGSRSKAGLKSIPCATVMLDEVDEMTQENIPLVYERMSGQFRKQIWKVSTPTLDDTGINKAYKNSTQEIFFFICPHCSRLVDLSWPDSLADKDSPDHAHLICKACKHPLDHTTKPDWLSTGRWVQSKPHEIRGFHISQLYSSTVSPKELSCAYLAGLTDQSSMQELFNSKLGLTYIQEGAKLSEQDITSLYGTTEPTTKHYVLGCDVGSLLHYVILEITHPHVQLELAKVRVAEASVCRDFADLDVLMHKYRIRQCIVDANPETRAALEFANRFFGLVHLCYYNYSVKGRDISENTTSVTVNRTVWMDLTLGRYRNKTVSVDTKVDRDFCAQLQAPVRVITRDQYGNPYARYEECGKADHFAHASLYAEVAHGLAISQTTNKPITVS